MARLASVLVLLVAALLSCSRVSSFAAWLECYVELLDDDEIIMNHKIVPAKDARYAVSIEVKLPENDHWGPSLSYAAGRPTTVMARLKVPYDISHSDVQYVMETSAGASFSRPKMCDGRRSHATSYSEAVILEINGNAETIELVAGYAMGHEAVTLTPTTILRRREEQEL